MAFNIPDRDQLKLSSKTDVQGELEGSNPFLKNGFLNAIVSAVALRISDFYTQLQEAIKQLLWDSATGVYLQRAASWFGIIVKPATQADGKVVAQGVPGTFIPISTQLSISGITYTSQTSATINTQSVFSVISLTRSGSTATCQTSIPHNQVTGLTVTMAGANEVEYNGTFSVTVTAPDTFTYPVSGSPATPATGTITASFVNTINIASLDRGGTIVTATTSADHNQATGVTAVIGGAVETEYNGEFIITVTDTDKFTYAIVGAAPTTPATGTLRAAFSTAVVPVKANLEFTGSQGNQDSGAILSFVTPIAGIEANTYVDFLAITGGFDQENTEDFRLRFLDRVQNPVANFNVSDIDKQARLVAGVTRTFIYEITPSYGQVTIYFTVDNDGIIPTAADVIDVKDSILLIKPGHTASADVFVYAPTPKSVDFTLTALDPNTTTMQNSINASLDVLFQENTAVGVDLQEDAYRNAIFNTIDTETGDRVNSFTLSTPSGNVSVASGEIPIKGIVTFP